MVSRILSRTMLPWTLSVCAVFAGASSTVAAPDSQEYPGQYQYPGQPTKARVWIENRGGGEAVPVSIENAAPGASLGVQIVGTPSVAIAAAKALDVRRLRQPWEYLTVSIDHGENPAGKLENLGNDGWETTGLQFASGGTSSVVLLKRPK